MHGLCSSIDFFFNNLVIEMADNRFDVGDNECDGLTAVTALI